MSDDNDAFLIPALLYWHTILTKCYITCCNHSILKRLPWRLIWLSFRPKKKNFAFCTLTKSPVSLIVPMGTVTSSSRKQIRSTPPTQEKIVVLYIKWLTVNENYKEYLAKFSYTLTSIVRSTKRLSSISKLLQCTNWAMHLNSVNTQNSLQLSKCKQEKESI